MEKYEFRAWDIETGLMFYQIPVRKEVDSAELYNDKFKKYFNVGQALICDNPILMLLTGLT